MSRQRIAKPEAGQRAGTSRATIPLVLLSLLAGGLIGYLMGSGGHSKIVPKALVKGPDSSIDPVTLPEATEQKPFRPVGAGPVRKRESWDEKTVASLPLGEVLRRLGRIPSMKPGTETDLRELGLVTRWATFQPKAACEYAYQAVLGGADESLLREAVAIWAQSAPEAAAAWAARLQSPMLRDLAVASAFRIWASRFPTAALTAIAGLPSAPARAVADVSAAQAISTSDMNRVLLWARGLPGPLREKTLQQVLGAWIRRDPSAAAEWLLRQPPEIQVPLIGRLAGDWARKDPTAALAWSQAAPVAPTLGSQLSPGDLQRRAFESALGTLIGADPEKAAAWLSETAGRPYFSSRVAAVAGSWTSLDPVSASAWAVALPAGKDRDTALGSVASTWTRTAPAEALQWALSLPRAPDRNNALAAYGRALASTDPATAAYWSSQITDRGLREGTLAGVVSVWKTVDPGAAAQFIQSSSAFAGQRKKTGKL